MADLFSRLAANTLGLTAAARPLRRSRFDPGPTPPGPTLEPEQPAAYQAMAASDRSGKDAPTRPETVEPATMQPTQRRLAPPAPTQPSTRPVQQRQQLQDPRPAPLSATAEPAISVAAPETASRSTAPLVKATAPTVVDDTRSIPRPTDRPAPNTEAPTAAPMQPATRTATPRLEPLVRPRREGDRIGDTLPRGDVLRRNGALRPAGEPVAQAAPDIQVTIGRIEVRAVPPPVPARPSPTRGAQTGPNLTLVEYLRQRREGKR